jgi:glutathione S-transferase
LKLYDAELSGNAYKIRLFLALLGLDHERVPIALGAGETRTEEFRRRNPRAQIPVLEDGEVTVFDSQAILVYLARRYAGEGWLPLEPWPMAEVMQWLAVAENELLFGLARARAVKLFGRPWDMAQSSAYGTAGLQVMDSHLAGREWLASGRVTIADVACYPYVALAPEGEIDLAPFANVRRWLGRIEALPGYVPMTGIVLQTG